MLLEEPELDWTPAGDGGGDGMPLAGRLVQPDAGSIDVDDVVDEVADAADDPFGLSAEEEAVCVGANPASLGHGPDGYPDGD